MGIACFNFMIHLSVRPRSSLEVANVKSCSFSPIKKHSPFFFLQIFIAFLLSLNSLWGSIFTAVVIARVSANTAVVLSTPALQVVTSALSLSKFTSTVCIYLIWLYYHSHYHCPNLAIASFYLPLDMSTHLLELLCLPWLTSQSMSEGGLCKPDELPVSIPKLFTRSADTPPG